MEGRLKSSLEEREPLGMRVFNRLIESLFQPARYTARRDLCNYFRLQLRSNRAMCGDQVQLLFVASLFFCDLVPGTKRFVGFIETRFRRYL